MNVVMNINSAALAALIVHAAAIAAYIIFLHESPYKDVSRSPSRLLKGDMAWPFWAGLVFGGMILPLGLTIYLQIVKTGYIALPVAALGLAGTLTGGTTIRAVMFALGSEADPTW
jgi:formate-dependent nitrite reductase membrane component NrfD